MKFQKIFAIFVIAIINSNLVLSLASTTTGAKVYSPKSEGELQNALNSAKPGEKILLEPITYTGNFKFPKKRGEGVITVDGQSGRIVKRQTYIRTSQQALNIEGDHWVIQNLKIVSTSGNKDISPVLVTGNKNKLTNIDIIAYVDAISVRGNDNELRSINVDFKLHGPTSLEKNGAITVTGNGNTGGQITIKGAKIGVRIVTKKQQQNTNKFEGVKLQGGTPLVVSPDNKGAGVSKSAKNTRQQRPTAHRKNGT